MYGIYNTLSKERKGNNEKVIPRTLFRRNNEQIYGICVAVGTYFVSKPSFLDISTEIFFRYGTKTFSILSISMSSILAKADMAATVFPE